MITQNARTHSGTNRLLFPILAACGLGLLLGILSGFSAGLIVFGILAAVFFIYAILKRPEIALLGILIATSSIIYEDQLPLISIGVGSLHISDILLLGMLALIGLRALIEPKFRTLRTPLDAPLLFFFGLALLATLIGFFQSSLSAATALRSMRVIFYYLTFFVVTNLVVERGQLKFFLNGLFLLATIVAVAMMVQYFLGVSLPILPGRVETLNTQGADFAAVTRILPPGWSTIMVAGVAVFSVLLQERIRSSTFFRLLQFGLLGVAIVVTFIRSYWAPLIMVMILSAFLVRARERQRLLGLGILAIFFLAAIVIKGTAQPQSQLGKTVAATYYRLATIWNPRTVNEPSLEWRYTENEYAVRSILAHPLIGLGFGARYRVYDRRLDSPSWDARDYVHNGHLWLMLDSGLLGYLAFIWLSVTFLVRGFQKWRGVEDDFLRGVVLGFTLIYLVTLIAAVTVPTYTLWSWTPVIGIIMGTNEAVFARFGAEAPAD